MTPTTETELKELRDLVLGLREEVRVGFADTRGEIQKVAANADLKLTEFKASTDIQLADLRGDVKVIEERTKLGFWGFVWRAVVIAVLVSLLSAANKFILNGGLGNLGL